jgi:glycosyltransferase involved in cell wall biosynthesis
MILVENESVPHDSRVWQHALSLRQAGVAVTVVCPQGGDDEQALAQEREGVAIRRFVPRPSDGGLQGYAREYGAALQEMRRHVRRLVADKPLDVVQACNPPDVLLLAALSARRRGAALVFDHHDLVPELFLTRFGERRLLHRATLIAERVGFALADVVISTNDFYREVAIARGRKRPEDIFVVRNAPGAAWLDPVEPDPSLRRGARHLVVYVGMMGPQDGIDRALRALASLARPPGDWRAVFVGEGEMLGDMRRLAAELDIDDRVEFTGWLEEQEVRRVVGDADVCLVPDPPGALNDVSSMVKVAEYMAAGRAIAAYALPETRRTAGDAAAYAADSSPEALAAVVEALLADADRRDRMGAEGRRRIGSGLMWEYQEPSLLAAYERAFAVADSRRR